MSRHQPQFGATAFTATLSGTRAEVQVEPEVRRNCRPRRGTPQRVSEVGVGTGAVPRRRRPASRPARTRRPLGRSTGRPGADTGVVIQRAAGLPAQVVILGRAAGAEQPIEITRVRGPDRCTARPRVPGLDSGRQWGAAPACPSRQRAVHRRTGCGLPAPSGGGERPQLLGSGHQPVARLAPRRPTWASRTPGLQLPSDGGARGTGLGRSTGYRAAAPATLGRQPGGA